MTTHTLQKLFGGIPEAKFGPVVGLICASLFLLGLSALLTTSIAVHCAAGVGFLSAMLIWARAVRTAPFLQCVLAVLIVIDLVVVGALIARGH
jgi:hypothetical protein